MNYLSHFYFDQAERKSETVLGIAFPDLIGSFDRRFKCPEVVGFRQSQEPKLHAFQKGINRHHELDALFHNGTFFDKQTKILDKGLRELRLKSIDKYYFFYAHILLELLLDRQLISADESLGEHFYEHISKDHSVLLEGYFESVNRLPQLEAFKKHLNQFIEHRYLFLYKSEKSIARALSRIHFRLRKYELDQSDIDTIAEAVPRFQKIIDASFADWTDVLK